jgi:hypothetical protein
MLRKLLALPIFVFGFFAIAGLVQGNLLLFFVWLFLGMLYLVPTYPLITEMNEKVAPVFHIFASLLLFVLFVSSVAILDFNRAGFPLLQSILYGLAIGILSMTAALFLQNK